MDRAFICVGLLALSALQCLADPILDAGNQPVGDWEAASVEAQRAAAASFAASMKDAKHMEGSIGARSLPRMAEADMFQQSSVQDVLDFIMKEFHAVFKSSPVIPRWDNLDYATETVKEIVERVRDRLSNINPGDGQETRGDQTAAASIRGGTNDFLREVMVQEAAAETLWAIFRDSQARPWMEQHAQQATATQAVHGFLNRMHERLRMVGFSEEDISKLLPRASGGLNCGREGPGGLFDTCPERNMGKKHRGSSAGAPAVALAYPATGYGYPGFGYSYPGVGYSYPGFGYGYPVSDFGCCGDCGTCGNCSCSRTTFARRLAVVENTREPSFPPVMPVLFPLDQMALPLTSPAPLPRGAFDVYGGMEGQNTGAMGSSPTMGSLGLFGNTGMMEEPRSMGSHYYRWGPSQGRPALGYYSYPGWINPYTRPAWPFGYPAGGYGSRRLEVPDINVPIVPTTAVNEQQPVKNTPRTRPNTLSTPQQQTANRSSGVRASLPTYDIPSNSAPLESGGTYYRDQPIMEPVQGLWTA